MTMYFIPIVFFWTNTHRSPRTDNMSVLVFIMVISFFSLLQSISLACLYIEIFFDQIFWPLSQTVDSVMVDLIAIRGFQSKSKRGRRNLLPKVIRFPKILGISHTLVRSIRNKTPYTSIQLGHSCYNYF